MELLIITVLIWYFVNNKMQLNENNIIIKIEI